jgi:hypothetical protein
VRDQKWQHHEKRRAAYAEEITAEAKEVVVCRLSEPTKAVEEDEAFDKNKT